MKKSLQYKISVLILMSICTHFVSAQQLTQAPFVPAQPVFQLPGTPLWTINAQVRPRAEIRDGLGDPMIKSASAPSGFISQRSNLNLGFRFDKFNFNMDIRDVRVWGQDAATINNVDGGKTFLHQAWGEFTIASVNDTTKKLHQIIGLDNLSLKVGRQEIVYDDSRLMGNLDWLQQGRRHDAAILKLTHKGYQVDLGAAFNQNTDAFNNTKVGHSYTPVNTSGYGSASNGALVAYPGDFVATTGKGGLPQVAGFGPTTNQLGQNYKTMFYLYATRKFNQTKFSLLAFNDNFSKWRLDSVTTGAARPGTYNVTAGGDSSLAPRGVLYGRRYDQGARVNSRFTVGGQVQTQFGNAAEGVKIVVNAGGYGQFGHNPSSKFINAYHAFIYGGVQKGKFTIGPGYEILSGNSTRVTGSTVEAVGTQDNRFDPLYGTPHRWWGYMDYFYVGTGSPRAGLQDFYLRGRYDANNFFVTLDVHNFMTAGKDVMWRKAATQTVTDPNTGAISTVPVEFEKLSSTYGQEVDLVLNYQISRFVNLEAGYSIFFATETLAAAKGLPAGKSGYDAINQWGYLQLNLRPEFLYQKPVAIKN